MNERLKYSVILPTRNGLRYLPYAIRSVLEQTSDQFELIVSDNYSVDGTWEYLSSLSDPRLRVVRPAGPLPMARHFEFALGQATGEWITVLGDDDALQPYFFELAEKLTFTLHHPVISSARAYFFWAGCESLHQDNVAYYKASDKITEKRSAWELAKLLLLPGDYFEGPQFYTGTLFKKELLDSIKRQQEGIVFKSAIVDANSITLIFKNVPRYGYSEIPLAWVGSSPKSTGFSQKAKEPGDSAAKQSADDFTKLNAKDSISYHERVPGFSSTDNFDLYFLEAFFQVHSGDARNFFCSKPALYLIFSKIYRTYRKRWAEPDLKKTYLKIFEANGLKIPLLACVTLLVFLISQPYLFGMRTLRFGHKILQRKKPGVQNEAAGSDEFSSTRREEFPTISDASERAMISYGKLAAPGRNKS